ncbi:hypothetical protein FO519_004823 [Halicephalobus sp. NKZ332]|nr:hypothetical protein FO519_004823 [Halicephalobus sp. NKZ332]
MSRRIIVDGIPVSVELDAYDAFCDAMKKRDAQVEAEDWEIKTNVPYKLYESKDYLDAAQYYLDQKPPDLMQAGEKIPKLVVSGALAGTSDVLCQKLIEKNERWDYQRTAKFAGLISCLIAPMSYKWFQFLERFLPGKDIKVALKRTALDQILGAPIFASIFLFNLNLLETKNIHNSVVKTSQLLFPVMSTNYKIWPFIQLVNLSVIPIQYRVVMVQFCGLFWNMYISFVQHKKPEDGLIDPGLD